MSAGKQGIQKQRINVTLKVSTIHLNAELVTQHQRDSEGIMLLVILTVLFGAVNNLLEGNKIIVRDGQGHVGQHLDPLLYPHLPLLIPDSFAVVLLIHGYNLVDG